MCSIHPHSHRKCSEKSCSHNVSTQRRKREKRRVKSTQQPKWVKIDIKPSYILLKKASSITLLQSKDGGLGRRGGTLFIGLNGSEFKTNCLGWIIEFVKSHPHWNVGRKDVQMLPKLVASLSALCKIMFQMCSSKAGRYTNGKQEKHQKLFSHSFNSLAIVHLQEALTIKQIVGTFEVSGYCGVKTNPTGFVVQISFPRLY